MRLFTINRLFDQLIQLTTQTTLVLYSPPTKAADALRVTGVGRNEYIAIMNACKAKKLMWRVNKALARDLLPPAEKEARLEPWWLVAVANVGGFPVRRVAGSCGAGPVLLGAACQVDRACWIYKLS